MPKVIVLYDACVLYPAPLRDLLMHLAMTDLYQAKWTNEIHDEWIRNVLANRPDLKQSQLDRTRELMNRHIRDCLVEGYERLIPSMKLPDLGDRHVLASAIHSSAFYASLKRAGLPYEAVCEVWRSLIDAFRTHEIKFEFSLQHIQTVFSSCGISQLPLIDT